MKKIIPLIALIALTACQAEPIFSGYSGGCPVDQYGNVMKNYPIPDGMECHHT